MNKKVTTSQRIGEIGEKAANLQFLRIGFQFDGRSRLEAGIDGIAEVMDDDQPTAKMIAVQVKATERNCDSGVDEFKTTDTSSRGEDWEPRRANNEINDN